MTIEEHRVGCLGCLVLVLLVVGSWALIVGGVAWLIR